MDDLRKTAIEKGTGSNGPCLFVSYLRTNGVVVEDILRRLRRNGFNAWWDQDITAGVDWEKSITGNLNRSEAFLGFISNGITQSTWSIKEILLAIERRKRQAEKNQAYPIVFIFLEKVPRSAFPEEIRNEMDRFQYIPFWEHGGITEDFITSLMSADWPDSIINPKYRQMVRNKAKGRKAGILGDFFNGGDIPFRCYHRLVDKPDKEARQEERPAFYHLIPGHQMEPDAAFPVVMDNQWVPPEYYDPTNPHYVEDGEMQKAFRTHGLASEGNEDLLKEIANRQRKEIFRALIHNWQVVINRAAIFNTSALREWYDHESADCQAFHNLIGDDSIVIYLCSESSPTDTPAFDYDQTNLEAWKKFCLECEEGQEVACLRFDWASEEGNRSDTSRFLANRFQNFCIVTGQDPYRQDILAMTFGIDSARQEAFAECWRAIQTDAVSWNRVTGGSYTRERFYESFLVNTKQMVNSRKVQVNDCILDFRKKYGEFIPALKQTIDYLYATNLPYALNIQPYHSPDSTLSPFLLADSGMGQRELTIDQLLYAVSEFNDSLEEFGANDKIKFLMNPAPYLPDSDELSLNMIWKLRQTEEWQFYLRALTDGKLRTRLNEVDFYNIPGIWKCHSDLLSKAQRLFETLHWDNRPAALSVIYRFEGLPLVVVYGHRMKKMRLPSEENVKRSGVRERKTGLHIDYVCTDVLEDDWATPFQSEIRLFEGITSGREKKYTRSSTRNVNGRAYYEETAENIYDALVEKLKDLGFETV